MIRNRHRLQSPSSDAHSVHAMQQPSRCRVLPADRQGSSGAEWRASHLVRNVSHASATAYALVNQKDWALASDPAFL